MSFKRDPNCLPYDTIPNFSFGTSNWKVGPITDPLKTVSITSYKLDKKKN